MTAGQSVTGGVAYRIWKGQSVGILLFVMVPNGGAIGYVAEVEYDNGSQDTLTIPPISIAAGVGDYSGGSLVASANGWLVAGHTIQEGAGVPDTQGGIYFKIFILNGIFSGTNAANTRQVIQSGYLGSDSIAPFGQLQPTDFVATWVFQGTVAEDATVGTHVCTLIVSAGGGNAVAIQSANITVGATATAQVVSAYVDDGSNNLVGSLINGFSATVSSAVYAIGTSSQLPGASLGQSGGEAQFGAGGIMSGAQRFVLKVSTAAVSVTQTFAVELRVKGTDLPTATLSDTVGTPTLTTNTNQLF